MKDNIVMKIVITGLVAALYATLTLAIAPLSFGPIQFRLSEIMVLLAFFNPVYIVGLTIGCLLANLVGGFGLMDIVFGTLATFISCIAVYYTGIVIKAKNVSLIIASIWPTVFNGLIVGWMLSVTLNIPMALTMVQVAFGEFVVVTIVGVPVIKKIFNSYGDILSLQKLKRA